MYLLMNKWAVFHLVDILFGKIVKTFSTVKVLLVTLTFDDRVYVT